MSDSPVQSRPACLTPETPPSAPFFASRTHVPVHAEFISQCVGRHSPLLGQVFADMVSPQAFLEASHAARATGTSVLDALLARADSPVEAMVRRLANRSRIALLDHETIDREREQITAPQASAALRSGILRLKDGRIIVVARGAALERIVPMLKRLKGKGVQKFHFASPRVFADLVMRLGGEALAQDAGNGASRGLSYTAERTGFMRVGVVIVLALAVASFWTGEYGRLLPVLGSAFFLMLAALRFYASGSSWFGVSPKAVPETDKGAGLSRIPDYALPVYTLLIPLFREAAVVEKLVQSICGLDYPAAKLDIKFLVEEEDHETRQALDSASLRGNMEVLVVAKGNPRTKPRALNVGLAAARGDYVAIYDAEDEPDADQLRKALAAFAAGGATLACVQGRLCIDNTQDNWLTRQFTLEYAALFDVFLPALARLRVLFPLGGTSNHFRVNVMRTVGGWDAHNVTEDADLGVRLGRLGYNLTMMDSTTWEEAPNRFRSWLTQRTRWMKGYMVTWAVHMRSPITLFRQLGMKDFVIFHAFIGGVPLVALLFPVFFAILGFQLYAQTWLAGGDTIMQAVITAFEGMTLGLGFSAAFAMLVAAMAKRSLWSLGLILVSVPFYWLCISLAAWRALIQLVYDPHVWEKTEHGKARTSRLRLARKVSRPL